MEDLQKTKANLLAENQALRDRLAISEGTLQAIMQGEVDALVVSTDKGSQVFTLKSADQSYRLLVEEMQQSAVILSDEELILYCNKSCSNLLHQPLEKLIGSSFKRFLSPQDTLLFQSQVKLAEKGNQNAIELFLIPQTGVEVPVYLSINYLKPDDVSMNCVVITDLTEQKRHERTLASERLARLMLEQAGEAILVCDYTGNIIRASQVACQLWEKNLLSQPFDTLSIFLSQSTPASATHQQGMLNSTHLETAPGCKVPFAIASVLNGTSFQGQEVEITTQDGQVINLLLNARPLADEDNYFRGAVVILTDITRRKQAETALQQLNAELEQRVAERTAQLMETNDHLLETVIQQQQTQLILLEQAQLLDLAHDTIITRDLNGAICFWNQGAESMYGWTKAEALGQISHILLKTQFPQSLSEIETEFFEKGYWEGELIHFRWDERPINVASRWVLQKDNAGKPIKILEINNDITERKLAQIALQQQTERERMVVAITQQIRKSLDLDEILNTTVAEVRQFLQTDRVIIYRINADWSGTVITESVAFGWKAILNMEITDTYFVETQGRQSYQQGMIKVNPDIYTAGLTACHLELLEQLQIRAKVIVPIFQQERLWGLLIAHHCSAPRQWQPWESELLQQLATQVAIAIQQSELYQQLQLANQRLENLAMVDKLTQIANRRCFDSRLDYLWQYLLREKDFISLLLCDIDYFKQYNDTYGHAVGDTCLTLIAQALKQTIKRSRDLVARYGGEEFVVILPNTASDGAVQVAQGIHQAIQQLNIPHTASAVKQHVTLTIGIATVIPTSDMLPLDLIKAADQALYQAKAQGRNRSCMWNPNDP
ncbi:MAG: diguanylate cyclase [Nostoc sp. NMS7]|uniref:diguanylate cyclase domain-containing protein n=1 Tax=Nostoc sp. NMS7 TaxID=2815391 RepID=UPI0025EFA3A7|nr:diguanylate cyclase [Nostoc sp. NMS7]MBN3945002.1 diguanylate cyclase [Nostoc sp. NMS7]